MTTVPEVRVREANKAQRNPEGDYVPYWMTAYRRLGRNHALQHAAELAGSMGKPLVILEVLLVDYPYASPRLHRFMLEGMAERARMLRGGPNVLGSLPLPPVSSEESPRQFRGHPSGRSSVRTAAGGGWGSRFEDSGGVGPGLGASPGE